MEVIYVVVGILIGFAVSAIIRRKHPVGFLRIDKSDSDGPYFLIQSPDLCSNFLIAWFLLMSFLLSCLLFHCLQKV